METLRYEYNDTAMIASIAYPEGKESAPGVMVAHDWGGKSESMEAVAKAVAKLGYVALAIDMYGEGRLGETMQEKQGLMLPLKNDRRELMGRINAGLEALKSLQRVDATRTGAIGFCFGGLCVLDLARSGAEVGGVVSFHGLLDAPDDGLKRPMNARVLVLHGHLDPMAPPEHVTALCSELEQAGVDFQIHIHGTALHAFTNPAANNPEFGIVYDKKTSHRSWSNMKAFLSELFDQR